MEKPKGHTWFDFYYEDGTVLYSRFWDTGIEFSTEHDLKIRQITKKGCKAPAGIMTNKKAHIKDAWKPGFQPALGEYIDDKGRYNRRLKEKGLIEAGNEYVEPVTTKKEGNYIDDSVIKQAVDSGANISGNEANGLKKGEKLV